MNIKEFAAQFCGYAIQPWQQPWIDHAENADHRALLLAPRGHGKTTTINYIWLAWTIANNPELRMLLVSHSKDMAEKFSMAVRNVMEIPELQEEFDFKESTPWRANSWRLNKSPNSKPTLECKGAMGRMVGWRGDMVIFDDLLEFSTESETNRLKLENWRNQSVIPAIDSHKLDKVIVVGTRKAPDDWYGELLEGDLYESRVDKAFQTDDYMTNLHAKVLAPFLYDTFGGKQPFLNREALLRKRAEIGSLKFEQEYQNNPTDPEGLELKDEWLQYYEHLPNAQLKTYIGIDPAGEGIGPDSSYFAMCAVAHDPPADRIYVLDLHRSRCSKREQVQKAFEWMIKYNPEAAFIENVFEYSHVYDALVRHFRNVKEKDYIHTRLKGNKDASKEGRIREILAPAYEMRRIFMRKPSIDPMTALFLKYEYKAFPMGDKDILDSMVLAVHSIVKVGYIDRIPWMGVG